MQIVKLAPAEHTANGLSLLEYAQGLASNGRRNVPGAPGSIWVRYDSVAMMRIPLFCLEPPDATELSRVLWQGPAAVVSYSIEPDHRHPTNAWLYVCTDRAYALDKLISRMRRDVRRGLREFRIGPITAEQLAAHGAQAFRDTLRRNGLRDLTPDEFRRQTILRPKYPGHVFFGAWKDDNLAAYLSIIEVEDWAEIRSSVSADAFLRFTPNDALLYSALSYYLVEKKCRIVTIGSSSIQSESNRDGLHAFKTKVGFEARPVHRAFVLHPFLRPLVNRLTLFGVNTALRLRPGDLRLKRLGGTLACMLGHHYLPETARESGR
jgi:hypothetical protein